MTLDNEEAKIVIGNNVPFVTGSYANTGGNSGEPVPNRWSARTWADAACARRSARTAR